MPEYQKYDLEVDSQGRTQTAEQRIARITSLYQSGAVRADIARDRINQIARGVYVSEIETTLLKVEPLDAVNMDQAVHMERANAARTLWSSRSSRRRNTGSCIASRSVKRRT